MNFLAYIVIAGIIFASGMAAGIKWHAGQDAIAENARLQLEREVAVANRATERQQAATVIGAVNDARQRETLARAAAAGARGELDRLRNDIDRTVGDLPSAAPDACPQRAATLGRLFDQCAGELEALAGRAQRHADDTLTLERAWPK